MERINRDRIAYRRTRNDFKALADLSDSYEAGAGIAEFVSSLERKRRVTCR